MIPVPELYCEAEQEHIAVLRYPLPQTGSLSVMLPDGTCYIGMDDGICDSGTSERVHLSHELGHCVTGAFYNIYALADLRQRHENRADKWAIQRLIPVEQLDDAIACGHTELWDLAEYFGVTESFLKKAICYYVHGNLASELYF